MVFFSESWWFSLLIHSIPTFRSDFLPNSCNEINGKVEFFLIDFYLIWQGHISLKSTVLWRNCFLSRWYKIISKNVCRIIILRTHCFLNHSLNLQIPVYFPLYSVSCVGVEFIKAPLGFWFWRHLACISHHFLPTHQDELCLVSSHFMPEISLQHLTGTFSI